MSPGNGNLYFSEKTSLGSTRKGTNSKIVGSLPLIILSDVRLVDFDLARAWMIRACSSGFSVWAFRFEGIKMNRVV